MEKINQIQFTPPPLTQAQRKYVEDHYNIDMTAKQISIELGVTLKQVANYYHVFCRSIPIQHEEFQDPNVLWAEKILRMPWRPVCTSEASDCV